MHFPLAIFLSTASDESVAKRALNALFQLYFVVGHNDFLCLVLTKMRIQQLGLRFQTSILRKHVPMRKCKLGTHCSHNKKLILAQHTTKHTNTNHKY